MNRLIDNLINGNHKDAKRLAKRFPNWAIREALMEDYGYSETKATLTADWLKGRDCWQAACDAK
jgi:hypothetical protein